MPEKQTLQKSKKAKQQGKSASTQAGAFVEEEMRHMHEGAENIKSPKQAIAIGLSEARRHGVALPAPKASKSSSATRKKAEQDLKKGRAKKKS